MMEFTLSNKAASCTHMFTCGPAPVFVTCLGSQPFVLTHMTFAIRSRTANSAEALLSSIFGNQLKNIEEVQGDYQKTSSVIHACICGSYVADDGFFHR